MLQRRNTIHPGISRPSRQALQYAPTNSNTNPFLGRSSFDSLPSLTKQARNSKSTENTNPFLFDLSPKDLYKDTPLTKAKGDLQQQEGDSIRGRRMSLDVLKAPFAWNRRRRTNSVATTTGIAPLIKSKTSRRPVTVFVPSEQTDHEEIFKTPRGQQEWQTTMDSFTFPPAKGNDEILKSSRYCPDENTDPILGDLPKRAQTLKADRTKSFNPFLNDSGPILDQQLMQAPTEPESTHRVSNPPRRRHSEFSGLSAEDCSRLLSQQTQAPVQRDEGELLEDPTASQPHVPPQHRRYSSVHHAHMRHQSSNTHTPQTLRSRRNTIVARSPAPNHAPSPQTYQLVDPGVQKNDVTMIKPFKPFGNETQIDTNYDPWANVARNISAGNFTDPTPISPLDDDLPQPSRPWNCSRQWSRRSSQSSYAQEFSKDGDRYRPWTWANNSSSSYAPSLSSSSSTQSPTSMYHDDENLNNALDRESSRIKSRYRAMKEIQLRPYGQDDEDEVDDGDADDVAERSYPEEPVHPLDNLPDTHNDPRDVDVDALIPYKQALKEDYDTSPRASDVTLSEESQQELYRMAFACSPASIRMQQHQVPEYGYYYPDRQQQPHMLNPSTTSTSIASSGTLKSKGRASLTRTKTVLRQVKRRVSVVAQTVVTQANQALVRKNTGSAVNKSPQEDRQQWIQEDEEEVRYEEYSSHQLYDSHDPFQRYNYDHDHHTYSSQDYHDHHRGHDEDPTLSMYENHFENNNSSLGGDSGSLGGDSGSLGGGSRFGSSNSIRRSLYSASRSSLHKSKTLLRQVKRRVSNAAQSMVSHAGALSRKQSQDGSAEEVGEFEERNRPRHREDGHGLERVFWHQTP